MRNEAKIILKSGQDPNLVKQNILINKQVDQLNTFKAVAEAKKSMFLVII